jgi:hypothetical protein
MLGGNDPACAGVMEAFHKSLGRPECDLSYGDSFTLHILKGQSLKQALTLADEFNQHPDNDATPAAIQHVQALLANL